MLCESTEIGSHPSNITVMSLLQLQVETTENMIQVKKQRAQPQTHVTLTVVDLVLLTARNVFSQITKAGAGHEIQPVIAPEKF